MTNDFEMSVETVEQFLEESEDLTSFMFAYQRDGSVQTMKGNQPNQGNVNYPALIASQLRSLAEDLDIHPAILGHAVTRLAIEQNDMMTFNYDEYLSE